MTLKYVENPTYLSWSDHGGDAPIYGDKRLTVIREEDVDTQRLYGPLHEAIKYLQEIESQGLGKSLEEVWQGYEDMTMSFSWESPEEDDEYDRRIEQEKYFSEAADKRNKSKKRKAEGLKKMAALKKQYGL